MHTNDFQKTEREALKVALTLAVLLHLVLNSFAWITGDTTLMILMPIGTVVSVLLIVSGIYYFSSQEKIAKKTNYETNISTY